MGWPKMLKNTKFLAAPGAAKVAKGPLGGNGPHRGGQKPRKIRGFWPPQGRPRWLRDPLGPMGSTGVAKNVEKYENFGRPRPTHLPTYLPTNRFIVLLIEVGGVTFSRQGQEKRER